MLTRQAISVLAQDFLQWREAQRHKKNRSYRAIGPAFKGVTEAAQKVDRRWAARTTRPGFSHGKIGG